jgi:hypothetical protein
MMSVKSIITVVIGAIALLWIALVNGQPFFYPDTANYVREPDAAVVIAFGPQFATPWTTAQVIEASRGHLRISSTPTESQPNQVVPPDSKVMAQHGPYHNNSLRDGLVMAGRSAYYGTLLYIGELAGGFWLSVFVQALVIAYLVFMLVVRCYGLSLGVYLLSTGTLATISTAPFFVGFLMPDIFAGVTILVTAILMAFWNRLKGLERVILALILVFSTIVHLTHLMVCIAMLGIYIIVNLLRRVSYQQFRVAAVVTIAACAATAILADLCFSVVVSNIIGFPPVRPPFVMAKLIEIGPGYEYLKANCSSTDLTVCRFLKQLPVPADTFLWSEDPSVGVFTPASPQTKRGLSEEQYAFAIRVLMYDPIGVSLDLLRNALDQLVTFGLTEFHYCIKCAVGFHDQLPAEYWRKMQHTIAFRYNWPARVSTIVDYIFVMLSVVVIAAIALIHFNRSLGRYFAHQLDACQFLPIWFFAAVVVGIGANALICGAFSAVQDRYQARVIWLVPLAAVLAVARCVQFGSTIRALRGPVALEQISSMLVGTSAEETHAARG